MHPKNIHFVSYATNRFNSRREVLSKILTDTKWVGSFHICNENNLSNEFKQKYKDILSLPRGGGYWLWKSEIIKKRLSSLKENEILLYADAGCTLNFNTESFKKFNEYIDITNEHSMLRFQMSHLPEYKYSNSYLLNFFKDNFQTKPDHFYTGQYMATVFLIKNNKQSRDFFNLFFDIIDKDPFLITDNYNNISPIDGFIDHRHDQSILSLLTKTLNFGHTLEDETYYLNWGDGSKFPILATRLNT